MTPDLSPCLGLVCARTDQAQRAASGEAEQAALRSPVGQEGAALANALRRRAEGITAPIAREAMPALRFAAQQRVARAAYSAELVGHYPAPTAPASEAELKRSARQRIKPGQLVVFYGKTQKRLEVELYDEAGRMRPSGYQALTELLCDPGKTHLGVDPWIAYHPRLFAMLYLVGRHFDKPVEVVSAFRVPPRRGGGDSNHGRGRAVDINIEGVNRRALLSWLDEHFVKAGVGWYPNSTFVHLDTRGASYYWTDPSGPGRRQRNRERKPGKKARHSADPTADTVHLGPSGLHRVP